MNALHPRAPKPVILYPTFPLSVRRGHNAPALARSTSRVGTFIVKMVLVIALAAVTGILMGAALGLVVVVAMI